MAPACGSELFGQRLPPVMGLIKYLTFVLDGAAVELNLSTVKLIRMALRGHGQRFSMLRWTIGRSRAGQSGSAVSRAVCCKMFH